MAEQDSSAPEGAEEETKQQRAQRLEREDAAKMAELRVKHGKHIAVFEDEEFGRIVLSARGKRKEYQALVNSLQDDGADNAIAMEQFALDCVAEPSRIEAQKIFKDWPALASRAAARAMELAGGTVRELGKA